MKQLIKDNYKFALFLLFFGFVGGIFTALYTLESYSPELLAEAAEQLGSTDLLLVITVCQSVLYSVVLGLTGKFLAKKVGLWKNLSFEKKSLLTTGMIALLSGAALILFDVLIFNHFAEVVKESYNAKPTFVYIMAALTYGGVVEEVMLRLFLMSLLSFLMYKLFVKDKAEVPTGIFIVANIITALLFAAGHLPATIAMIGINPAIIIRCFLLNGGVGLCFGYLYRKHGIQYAMLAHAGCHVVSKLIWIIFI